MQIRLPQRSFVEAHVDPTAVPIASGKHTVPTSAARAAAPIVTPLGGGETHAATRPRVAGRGSRNGGEDA